MNFVVVEIAGKQFLVRKNDTIKTPKLTGSTGETVTFSKALLYWDGKKISLGRPYLDGFSVEGRIISSGRSPKIIVYKYKRRKDSHRKMGHRQDFYMVEIEKIVIPGRGGEVAGREEARLHPERESGQEDGHDSGREEGKRRYRQKAQAARGQKDSRQSETIAPEEAG